MSQPLSIENSAWTYLITTRTSGSRLWFLKNPQLEERVLGCLARYQEIYGAEIFAFILMGNHYHLIARFPRRNRALFMRDFNSSVARLVGRYVKSHGRRSVWARRYSYQILACPEDVRHWFFYVALNPVSAGIVENIANYPTYNSFVDAVAGNSRIYRWIDWSAFLQQKRHKKQIREEDFVKEYELRFSKLPGLEHFSPQHYSASLKQELMDRTKQIAVERYKAGKGFLGMNKFRAQQVGDVPKNTKLSTRYSFRPLVLSLHFAAKKAVLDIYFSITAQFLEASRVYRETFTLALPFPAGTYPPPRLVCCAR